MQDNREIGAFLSTTSVHNFNGFNKVCGVINNKCCEVLIDTGSTVNCISSALARKLECVIQPISALDYKVCTLANGAQADFVGKVNTFIQFKEVKSAVDFYVLQSNCEYAIIGCNLLQRLGAVINFGGNYVQFKDATINFCEADDEDIYVNDFSDYESDSDWEICEEKPTSDNRLEGIELCGETLTKKQKQSFMSMLKGHETVFADNLQQLGKCNVTECDIELKPGTPPIFVKPYKNAWSKRKVMEEQCKMWLEAGIIKENKNPKYNFPCVLVPKKGSKKLRLCINFQELNKHVVPEPHHTMTIDEFLCDFGAMKGRVFSVLDLG